MSKKPSTPPLTFAQYNRIYNVLFSLAQHFTRDEGRECVFYSINAAAIMHAHYGRNAKVICGLGAVVVHRQGDTPTAVSWFTVQPDGRCIATLDTFHCWVECDGWVIDFSAPNYQRALDTSPLANERVVPRIPRRMLQKPISQVDTAFDRLTRVGRAMFAPDQTVTTSIIDKAFDIPATTDIARIACTMHRPLPHFMPPSITITNDLNQVTTIPLIKQELEGAW